MKVIDKILNEWSYRCHDGIVDLTNPDKVSILKEIMIEEGIDEDIMDAILNLPSDDPKKQKVLNILTNDIEDERDKEIEKLKQQVGGSKEKKQAIIQKLESKSIPKNVSRYIVFAADEEEQLEDLNQLIDSLSKNDLEKGNSLKEKVGNLNWINDIVSGQSSLGTGKGEILLALMLDGGKLSDQTYGDVQLGNINIEVKQSSISSKSVFQGAIISDLGRSNDYKTLWNSKVLDNGQSFKEKYGFEKLLSTWTPIYKKYKEVSDKDRYVEDLKKVMKTGDFDNVDEITKKDFEGTDPQNFYKKIAYCSVGEYLEDKLLVLMNSNLDYVYLNEEEYKDAILNNSLIYANNAFSPRISYKEKIEDQEETEKSKPKSKLEVNIWKGFIKSSGDEKQYVKERWINTRSDNNLKKQFDCTTKDNTKEYCLLKPDANITLIPTNEKPNYDWA